MPYVVTRLCRDCVDGSCVEVCPVDDCFLEPRDRAASGLPNQLFIHPDRCVDCGACEPECPWGAIALDDDVPRLFHDDIALNARTTERPHDFVSAPLRKRLKPTAEEVEANRRKWEEPQT
jgi:NAD-dependent dihydropyrimidine dehydrogenase PreA subunit